MSTDKDDSRGRCTDILGDALNAAEDAIPILDSMLVQGSETAAVVQSVLKNTRDGITAINNLQKWCAGIDHSDRGSPAMRFHTQQVDRLLGYPEQISGMIGVVVAWLEQQRTLFFRDDAGFCEKLVVSMLREIGVNVQPHVVFADHFGVYDSGSSCFVSIPYVLAKRYNRWAGIAHEVGHAFQRGHLSLDQGALLEILFGQLKDLQVEGQVERVETIVLNWFWNWLPELLADFVALSLFGMFYVLEIHHRTTALDYGSVWTTHPPMSIRLSCFRAALAKAGTQLEKGDSLFESPAPVPEKLDQVLNAVIGNRLAPPFIDWVLRQPGYAELRTNWNEILDPSVSSSLISKFAAVCLASYSEDMSEVFELLKTETTKDQ